MPEAMRDAATDRPMHMSRLWRSGFLQAHRYKHVTLTAFGLLFGPAAMNRSRIRAEVPMLRHVVAAALAFPLPSMGHEPAFRRATDEARRSKGTG